MDQQPKQAAQFLDPFFNLLAVVNTWKKVAIFIVLALFLAAVYGAWDNRREVTFWAMSQFGTPKIDPDAIATQASSLMADTGAASVTIWSIDLQRNQRHALYVNVGNRQVSELEGLGDLALRPRSEQSANLIRMLNDQTWCGPLVQSSAVEKALASNGITYACAAAIPPTTGFFIGIVSVGFRAAPDNDDYIRQRLISAAEGVIE
ncbi:MAG: hypothetical protein ACTINL_10640 [Serratia proteamaculans]